MELWKKCIFIREITLFMIFFLLFYLLYSIFSISFSQEEPIQFKDMGRKFECRYDRTRDQQRRCP